MIATIARSQVKAGDMPGAVAAWKVVLKPDNLHEDARRFFASINQLDEAPGRGQRRR